MRTPSLLQIILDQPAEATTRTYKGHPTITLPAGRQQFTFGIKKAQLIQEYYKDIVAFLVEHNSDPTPVDVPFEVPDYAPDSRSLAQWIVKTGGVKDTSLRGEIKDLCTDVGKAHKRAKGIPPGFLNNKRGRGLDEIVDEANSEGWQIEDESHLLEMLETEQKEAYNL